MSLIPPPPSALLSPAPQDLGQLYRAMALMRQKSYVLRVAHDVQKLVDMRLTIAVDGSVYEVVPADFRDRVVGQLLQRQQHQQQHQTAAVTVQRFYREHQRRQLRPSAPR